MHEFLGYATFAEYVGRWLGYGFRSIEEKLRVAAALETLPVLDEALASGRLTWSAVRELTRVATAETEQEWLRSAEGQTIRQLERWVAGRRPGDLPADSPHPEQQRHVLRFEVSGETLAAVREALERVREIAGEPLDDDRALMQLAREQLASGQSPERSSYQVSVTTCDQCARSFQLAKGELIEIDPAVAEMAACDGDAHVGGQAARRSVPRGLRRRVFRRDRGCCAVPGCRNTRYLDVHHIELRSEGGLNDPDNLILICGAHHSAAHRGTLRIEGTASAGVRFRHADGTPYGSEPSPENAHVGARVFAALRGLGFSEKEARKAVDRASQANATNDSKQLLRAALAAGPRA